MALRPSDNGGAPLTRAQIEANFADLTPALSCAQAGVEADRCLYCWDAPCIQACPTSIEIPEFIRQISTGNLRGSAHTILKANILGGTCGRACPTEILCEGACVLNAREEEPVKIGALQRHAVEELMAKQGPHPFTRGEATGKRLAVVGAGPAGLAFAHRAAVLGHTVTIFEARPKPGGLNEYGLAAYKMAGGFAQAEVDFVLGVGGIGFEHGRSLGQNLSLDELHLGFDAVFIGVGLSGVRQLGVPGEHMPGVLDAIDFIAGVRQAEDKSALSVGREVIVIGGGNTAVDAAVQARRLGAANVTLAYRRGEATMGATAWERDLSRLNGVSIRTWAVPISIEGSGSVEAVRFENAQGGKDGGGGDYVLPADMVLKAIGQLYEEPGLAQLERDGAKLKVDADYHTSRPGVFAGGDCIATGLDLTVQAVEDGKRAAEACDRWLRQEGK